MRPDIAALFQDVNVFGGEFGFDTRLVVVFDEAGEVKGAAQSGWACADDEHIGFELFAFDGHSCLDFSRGEADPSSRAASG